MKTFVIIGSTLISLYFISCTKSSDQISRTQKLLVVKAWILQYTDSITVDYNNVVHNFRIPATSCAHQESLSFLDIFTYRQRIVCNQPIPQMVSGQWALSKDQLSISYGLASDSVPKESNILKISEDTLQLGQFTKFSSSVISETDVFATYSH